MAGEDEILCGGKKRCVPQNVVLPEKFLDLDQVRFVNKNAIVGRLQVDAANVHIQVICRRRN